MHKHLARQLRRLGLSGDSPPSGAAWAEFLESVSRTYEDGDNERYTLERSITLSSAEMRDLHARIRGERDRFRAIFAVAVVGILRIEHDGVISEANREAERMLGRSAEELRRVSLSSHLHPSEREESIHLMRDLLSGKLDSWVGKRRVVSASGEVLDLHLGVATAADRDKGARFVIITMIDETEKNRLELELRHAQKLESVGRLAAGIAHEINTPIQFVGDNLSFLQSAATDMFALCDVYQRLLPALRERPLTEAEVKMVAEAERDADVEFLKSHAQPALEDSREGIARVATIVRAMKAFAHPDRGARVPADLNAALRNTVTVATNELRYVADVELELSEIPMVSCFISELNQVFLNLLINAAHAIADAGPGPERRGSIRVRSYRKDDAVIVEFIDSGCGIPEFVRDKVFDPFFTTKDVGRGSGQGLAISRSVIVDKHGGQIWFDTEVGKGTTFYLKLPISAPAPAQAQTRAA